MKKTIIKQLAEQHRAGQLNRREFIAGVLAAGATLPMAFSFSESALAAQPRSGGTLRLGVSGGATTDSLDPASYTNEIMSLVARATHNYLVEVTPNGELIPELAESVEPSPGAKSWAFKLRKGVEFQNGKEVTADDVIATFQHHMGEETKSAAKSSLTQIQNMRKDGKYTVIFDLAAGNADFPWVCSDYHLPIMASKDGKMDWESYAGSGGYSLEAFEPGVNARLKRNPNYWKDGRAHVEEVEITVILDTAARQTALQNDAVDAIDKIDTKTAHLMERVPGVRIEEVTGRLHHSWPMRVESAPFDNNHFRLAIKHGVERQEMLDKVLNGRGTLGNDNPISSVYDFYADFPQRMQDIDKAKYHLKKSGLGKVTVDLSASDGAYGGSVDAALLMKNQLAKVGINVNVIREPKDGYWSNVWRKKPWCACYWNGRPTIDWMMTSAYAADSAYNDAGWQHDKFNKLLVLARAELDRPKRAVLYREMQAIVRDEGATLITSFGNNIFGFRDNLQHSKIGGDWTWDGGRAIERWWLKG